MLSLKDLNRLQIQNYICASMIYLWGSLGFAYFANPPWAAYISLIVPLISIGILSLQYLYRRNRSQYETTQTASYDGGIRVDRLRFLRVGANFLNEPVIFFGRVDRGALFSKGWQKGLFWVLMGMIVLGYYSDLSLVWSAGVVTVHAFGMLVLVYWLIQTRKGIKAQSVIFFKDGILFNGELLRYDVIQRYQMVPLKESIRFELNTGHIYLAFSIANEHQEKLKELLETASANRKVQVAVNITQ